MKRQRSHDLHVTKCLQEPKRKVARREGIQEKNSGDERPVFRKFRWVRVHQKFLHKEHVGPLLEQLDLSTLLDCLNGKELGELSLVLVAFHDRIVDEAARTGRGSDFTPLLRQYLECSPECVELFRIHDLVERNRDKSCSQPQTADMVLIPLLQLWATILRENTWISTQYVSDCLAKNIGARIPMLMSYLENKGELPVFVINVLANIARLGAYYAKKVLRWFNFTSQGFLSCQKKVNLKIKNQVKARKRIAVIDLIIELLASDDSQVIESVLRIPTLLPLTIKLLKNDSPIVAVDLFKCMDEHVLMNPQISKKVKLQFFRPKILFRIIQAYRVLSTTEISDKGHSDENAVQHVQQFVCHLLASPNYGILHPYKPRPLPSTVHVFENAEDWSLEGVASEPQAQVGSSLPAASGSVPDALLLFSEPPSYANHGYLALLQQLQPIQYALHRDLVLDVLSQDVYLRRGYFEAFKMTFDVHSQLWYAGMRFLFSLLDQGPIDYGGIFAAFAGRAPVDRIVGWLVPPFVFQRSSLVGILNSEKSDVVFVALNLLLRVFRTLEKLLLTIERSRAGRSGLLVQLADGLKCAFRNRMPEFGQMYGLYNKIVSSSVWKKCMNKERGELLEGEVDAANSKEGQFFVCDANALEGGRVMGVDRDVKLNAAEVQDEDVHVLVNLCSTDGCFAFGSDGSDRAKDAGADQACLASSGQRSFVSVFDLYSPAVDLIELYLRNFADSLAEHRFDVGAFLRPEAVWYPYEARRAYVKLLKSATRHFRWSKPIPKAVATETASVERGATGAGKSGAGGLATQLQVLLELSVKLEPFSLRREVQEVLKHVLVQSCLFERAESEADVWIDNLETSVRKSVDAAGWEEGVERVCKGVVGLLSSANDKCGQYSDAMSRQLRLVREGEALGGEGADGKEVDWAYLSYSWVVLALVKDVSTRKKGLAEGGGENGAEEREEREAGKGGGRKKKSSQNTSREKEGESRAKLDSVKETEFPDLDFSHISRIVYARISSSPVPELLDFYLFSVLVDICHGQYPCPSLTRLLFGDLEAEPAWWLTHLRAYLLGQWHALPPPAAAGPERLNGGGWTLAQEAQLSLFEPFWDEMAPATARRRVGREWKQLGVREVLTHFALSKRAKYDAKMQKKLGRRIFKTMARSEHGDYRQLLRIARVALSDAYCRFAELSEEFNFSGTEQTDEIGPSSPVKAPSPTAPPPGEGRVLVDKQRLVWFWLELIQKLLDGLAERRGGADDLDPLFRLVGTHPVFRATFASPMAHSREDDRDSGNDHWDQPFFSSSQERQSAPLSPTAFHFLLKVRLVRLVQHLGTLNADPPSAVRSPHLDHYVKRLTQRFFLDTSTNSADPAQTARLSSARFCGLLTDRYQVLLSPLARLFSTASRHQLIAYLLEMASARPLFAAVPSFSRLLSAFFEASFTVSVPVNSLSPSTDHLRLFVSTGTSDPDAIRAFDLPMRLFRRALDLFLELPSESPARPLMEETLFRALFLSRAIAPLGSPETAANYDGAVTNEWLRRYYAQALSLPCRATNPIRAGLASLFVREMGHNGLLAQWMDQANEVCSKEEVAQLSGLKISKKWKKRAEKCAPHLILTLSCWRFGQKKRSIGAMRAWKWLMPILLMHPEEDESEEPTPAWKTVKLYGTQVWVEMLADDLNSFKQKKNSTKRHRQRLIHGIYDQDDWTLLRNAYSLSNAHHSSLSIPLLTLMDALYLGLPEAYLDVLLRLFPRTSSPCIEAVFDRLSSLSSVWLNFSRSELLERIQKLLKKGYELESTWLLLDRVLSLSALPERPALLTRIHELIIHHSAFTKLLFSAEPQMPRLPMLSTLVQIYADGSPTVEEVTPLYEKRVLAYYLSAYEASLTHCDQRLFQIILLFELHGISLAQAGCSWSHVARKYHLLGTLEQQRASSQDPETIANVSNAHFLLFGTNLIEHKRIFRTVKLFPVHLSISPGRVDTRLYDLADLWIYGSHSLSTEALRQVYDPRFLLHVFYFAVCSISDFDCLSFVTTGCLSLTFMTLASTSACLRQLAYAVLGKYFGKLDSSTFSQLACIRWLLKLLKDTLESPLERIPGILSSFLAHSALVLVKPEQELFLVLQKYLMGYPILRVVPDFSAFLQTKAKEASVVQEWILNVVECGLLTWRDVRLVKRSGLVSQLMTWLSSYLTSPIALTSLRRRMWKMLRRVLQCEALTRTSREGGEERAKCCSESADATAKEEKPRAALDVSLIAWLATWVASSHSSMATPERNSWGLNPIASARSLKCHTEYLIVWESLGRECWASMCTGRDGMKKPDRTARREQFQAWTQVQVVIKDIVCYLEYALKYRERNEGEEGKMNNCTENDMDHMDDEDHYRPSDDNASTPVLSPFDLLSHYRRILLPTVYIYVYFSQLLSLNPFSLLNAYLPLPVATSIWRLFNTLFVRHASPVCEPIRLELAKIIFSIPIFAGFQHICPDLDHKENTCLVLRPGRSSTWLDSVQNHIRLIRLCLSDLFEAKHAQLEQISACLFVCLQTLKKFIDFSSCPNCSKHLVLALIADHSAPDGLIRLLLSSYRLALDKRCVILLNEIFVCFAAAAHSSSLDLPLSAKIFPLLNRLPPSNGATSRRQKVGKEAWKLHLKLARHLAGAWEEALTSTSNPCLRRRV